ncbi:MAG: hypothetical protein K2G46_04935, partial [Bacteroidales bacterium]|nr:hypothetical protein [Bacteroidales bacterium]
GIYLHKKRFEKFLGFLRFFPCGARGRDVVLQFKRKHYGTMQNDIVKLSAVESRIIEVRGEKVLLF